MNIELDHGSNLLSIALFVVFLCLEKKGMVATMVLMRSPEIRDDLVSCTIC